ncbi:MAG: HDOD domain-containing protein [Pseudomonadota bacterium]
MHALLAVAEEEFDALGEALSGAEDEWTWVHAPSPDQARQRLNEVDGDQPFDVVVSDVGLMGSEWLHEVAEQSPMSTRLALTDDPPQAGGLASVALAHQCLARRTAAEQLTRAMGAAKRWRPPSADASTLKRLTRLRSVPALPRTHGELMGELQEEEPNLSLIAQVIADDPAMSAKLLQLINSPYFGVREEVASIKQAVLLLGLQTLRDLAISHALFQAFGGRVDSGSLERLWREGHVVAALVDRLSRHLELDEAVRGELRLAAFVHDIGRLALLAVDAEGYADLTTLHGEALVSAERERYGMDHAAAGAYVLDLWGLPESLVQAVYHHHRPPSDSAQWPYGWLISLAALFTHTPIEALSDETLGEWAALSEVTLERFAETCREVSAMVHGA